jgi:hypothetical protein
VATVICYGDESGLHDEAPVFVFAGWIAPQDEWTRFVPRWRDALQNAGLAEGVPFHMTDFESGRRAFDGWTADRRRALITSLVDILVSTNAFGCGMVVDRERARTLGVGGEWFASEPYTAAFPLFQSHCVFHAGAFLDGDLCIDFVMDRQQTFGHAMRTIHDHQRDKSNPISERTGSLEFESAADNPPLQAADLLAFELRKETEARRVQPIRPARRSWLRLYATNRIAMYDATDEARSLGLLLHQKYAMDGGIMMRLGKKPGTSKKVFVKRA